MVDETLTTESITPEEIILKNIKNILYYDGSDTSRDYEVNLTSFVHTDFNIEAANRILDKPNEYNLFNEKDDDLKILYAVFYCINIYHRHNFNNEKLNTLWNKYSSQFEKFESLPHLDINRFLLELNFCNDLDKQQDFLQRASNEAARFHENAGYKHAFALLFVDIIEKNENDVDFYTNLIKDWYSKAINAINSAIQLDPNYARYYCTKGRILSIMGNYKEADEQICTAIVKEDSAKYDYAIIINKYQYYRIQNQSKMQLKNFQCQIENVQEEIDKTSNSIISNIETIALFSGVVSFILGTLTITNETSIAHAALLIVVLMSCLMIVFVAFILLLHSSDKKFNKGSCYFLLVFSIIIIMGVSNDKNHICFFKIW